MILIARAILIFLCLAQSALAADGFNSAPNTDLPLGAGGGSPTVIIKSGSGNVGIKNADPQTALDVGGGVRIGNENICNAQKTGTLRYNSDKLQICDAATLQWKEVGGGQAYKVLVTFPGYESRISCEMFTNCSQTIWPGVTAWDEYMTVTTYAAGGYGCTHTQIWCGGCLVSPNCYVSITKN